MADREAVRTVMDDSRFDRLAVARSRHFVFLGPSAFIEALPEKQRLMLDLAYIFQSDLAVQPGTDLIYGVGANNTPCVVGGV